jgi:hypothetical protein
MRKLSLLLAVIIMIWSNILIAEQTVSDHQIGGKHLESGLTCIDCHQSDTPTDKAPVSACNSCHGTYTEIAELTQGIDPNPHDSHQGEIDCDKCHRSHQPSVNYCSECHEYEFNVK